MFFAISIFSSFDPGYLVRKESYRLQAMSSSLPFFLVGVRRLNLEHLVRHDLDPVASAPGVIYLFLVLTLFIFDRMELLDHRRSHEDLFSFPLITCLLLISGFGVLAPKA